MGKKIKCAIIGPGNIGTDLLIKVKRSSLLEPLWMIGVIEESAGLAYARNMGVQTTCMGIDAILSSMIDDGVQIVFDASSASAHKKNAHKVKQLGALMVDLTPAAIGHYCVPSVNIDDVVNANLININMVTCGGQATIPIVAAINQVQSVAYGEIIATVSSKSAGMGTRKNIDEFTRTTAKAIETIGGATKGKAIVIINPAEPPLIMRDTVHCLTAGVPEEKNIILAINTMVKKMQDYVPGYQLKNGPVFDGHRVSVYLEVEGLGDFLPKYAGNLDIMTAAGLHTAEMYAKEMLAGRWGPVSSFCYD